MGPGGTQCRALSGTPPNLFGVLLFLLLLLVGRVCTQTPSGTLSPEQERKLLRREFELLFSPRNDEWPAPHTHEEFLDCLRSDRRVLPGDLATRTNLSFKVMFTTVIVTVNTEHCEPATEDQKRTVCNASRIAWGFFERFANASERAALPCAGGLNVTGAAYGYRPVRIPDYLFTELEPNTVVMSVMGALAAVLSIVQIGFGVHHFDRVATALFTLGSADERHD